MLLLGNRKALVEKSGLVKHATASKNKLQKVPSVTENKSNTNR